ncbi:MAG: hypothetical protein U1E56_13280 [Bauldia sp.]
MKKIVQVLAAAGATVATAAWAQAPAPAAPPPPGTVVLGAPKDIFMEVRTGPKGQPILSVKEFKLTLGGYYRFNFVCPDAKDDSTGFHLEVNDLLANSHLRVISVEDIEIYMQGMSFRAIECDEAGAARFSFHPMRRGVYDIYVREHSDPPQEAFGKIIVE